MSATTNANRKRKASDAAQPTEECPYLDTVQRSMLDFDVEPVCSITLETGPHIYCCLVCGQFFRGRGRTTSAYTHAVEASHYVFLHLGNNTASGGKFYCLPEDYEIHDASLQDIRQALHPTYTAPQIAALDTQTALCRDFHGRRYLPGFCGLNNHGKTDYINAVVQALAHVRPLRDFFLRQAEVQAAQAKFSQQDKATSSKAAGTTSQYRLAVRVAHCFGDVVRKLWSDARFKAHVDPHRLVNAITAAASGSSKFQVGQQAEAGEFMAWFLHQLHLGTGGTKKPGSSIVHQCFQGKIRVTTRQAKTKQVDAQAPQEDDRLGSEDEQEDVEMKNKEEEEDEDIEIEETTTDTRFLQLTLDIPEKPLFRDEDGGLVIPQEPLVNVLKKFDGVNFCDAVSRSGAAQRKLYQLTRLPDYLILHLARFTTNRYARQKNPTIVAFPVRNLDLSNYVFPDGGRPTLPTKEQVQAMSVKELKGLLKTYGQGDLAEAAVEKSELLSTVLDFVTQSLPDLLADKYDLVANITHTSPADVGREGKADPLQEGSYKCHVQHYATKQWYEIQDLHVQEIMAQQIGLSESYLLIFERKKAQMIKNKKR